MNTNDLKLRRDVVAEHLRGVPRSGIRDFFEIVNSMPNVISLGIGEPDFDTPWHVREASVFALEKGATGYTSNMGLPGLRREIARYVERTFGLLYDSEKEVLITVGVSEGLDLAVRALINPGDEVLYHEPCYVSYGPLVVFAHGRPVPVGTRLEDGFRITRELLEKQITSKSRILLLNYPNNPTGATLDMEDIRWISEFAKSNDLMVITDEIYAELTYGKKHVSIASMPDMKERTIFLHGFSKAWAMTGFRIGYACAPPELIEAMMKIHQYSMLCAPILSQEAAVEALKNPERDIGEMRSEYEKHRNFILRSLRDMGLKCNEPHGAFYIFPYVGDTGLSSKEFAIRLLEEEKVAVVPGSAFGSSGEGFVRCSYATSLVELKEAMSRMAKFIKRLRS